MSLKTKKWTAKVFLAWEFFWHLLSRVFFFWQGRDGLQTFLGNYRADAIFPISLRERKFFPAYQRCQACSLCTFSCVAIAEGRAPQNFEPKFILLGLGRSPHESEIHLEEWLPCVQCKRCTVDCPNNVPVHAMANQIIERWQRVGFRR